MQKIRWGWTQLTVDPWKIQKGTLGSTEANEQSQSPVNTRQAWWSRGSHLSVSDNHGVSLRICVLWHLRPDRYRPKQKIFLF